MKFSKMMVFHFPNYCCVSTSPGAGGPLCSQYSHRESLLSSKFSYALPITLYKTSFSSHYPLLYISYSRLEDINTRESLFLKPMTMGFVHMQCPIWGKPYFLNKSRKCKRTGSQNSWVLLPALSLIHFVALGKSFWLRYFRKACVSNLHACLLWLYVQLW